MRSAGLLITLIALIVVGYLTATSLKSETSTNTVQQGKNTGSDGVAQSALSQAIDATKGLIVQGETTSFTSVDLVKADASFSPATGNEQAGSGANVRAVTIQYANGVTTACNASPSGTSFCLRSSNGTQTFSSAQGSVAAALAAPFGPSWPTVSDSPSSTTNPQGAADDVQRQVDGLNGVQP